MKQDITARLRLLAQWPITPEGVTGMDAAKWCGEAAAEIERLRERVNEFVDEERRHIMEHNPIRYDMNDPIFSEDAYE